MKIQRLVQNHVANSCFNGDSIFVLHHILVASSFQLFFFFFFFLQIGLTAGTLPFTCCPQELLDGSGGGGGEPPSGEIIETNVGEYPQAKPSSAELMISTCQLWPQS